VRKEFVEAAGMDSDQYLNFISGMLETTSTKGIGSKSQNK